MRESLRGVMMGLCALLTVVSLTAQQMPQTRKEAIKGAAAVTTQELTGTVFFVEGNTLVVRMASGEIRHFDPPPSRRFIVDGKELTVSELKPGTKLKATVTTTATSVTDRTTTVGTGKVWFVSGNTVILTLPNGENRMYKVQDSYRFNVGGQKATVFDLRKGMTVSAEKIVESPRTEIASNTVVTGQAPPPPKPVVAETPRAPETPAPTRVAAAAPAPPPPAAASSSASASASAPEQVASAEPARLPKTASPLPIIGLLGFLCTGAAFGLRAIRRSN